jgi:hypothetical protein
MKNQILRKCIGCNQVKNRDEMLKITINHENNEIVFNPDSKTFGRSVYLCYNKMCIDSVLKKNRIKKHLKSINIEDFKNKINEQMLKFGKRTEG